MTYRYISSFILNIIIRIAALEEKCWVFSQSNAYMSLYAVVFRHVSSVKLMKKWVKIDLSLRDGYPVGVISLFCAIYDIQLWSECRNDIDNSYSGCGNISIAAKQKLGSCDVVNLCLDNSLIIFERIIQKIWRFHQVLNYDL